LLPGGSKAVPRQEFSFQIPPLGYLINRKTATKWRAIKFFTIEESALGTELAASLPFRLARESWPREKKERRKEREIQRREGNP